MPGFDVNQGYIGCARCVSVAARADAWPPRRLTHVVMPPVMPRYDRLAGPTS